MNRRDFNRLIRRGNSGQQPIHLQGVGKLDHELINKAVVADGAGDGDDLGVRRHLRMK